MTKLFGPRAVIKKMIWPVVLNLPTYGPVATYACISSKAKRLDRYPSNRIWLGNTPGLVVNAEAMVLECEFEPRPHLKTRW